MNRLRELKPQKDLRVDPQMRWIFTVGNVQGNSDNLLTMIRSIEDCNMFAKDDKVVFLGNFIGQEGSSKETVEILQEYRRCRPEQVVILRGANEQKMLAAKRNFYQSNLGKAVVNSYKSVPRKYATWDTNKVDVQDYTRDIEWIESLPCYHQSEKYFFVHAGVDPAKDLDKQHLGGFMFIQEPFYKSNQVYNRMVVHSHRADINLFLPNRIAVGQTVKGGLECMVLDDVVLSREDNTDTFTVPPEEETKDA